MQSPCRHSGLARRYRIPPVCLVIVLAACAVFENQDVASLRAWKEQATQEQIEQQWGAPTRIRSLAGGESMWVYEKREEQPGSRYTAPGTWCDQYTLTFTAEGLLRDWGHRSYFHGGELMPRTCIP